MSASYRAHMTMARLRCARFHGAARQRPGYIVTMLEFNRCVMQRGLTSTELRPTYTRRRFSFTLWPMVFDDVRLWLVRNN
jgi:hypothetical protein